VENLRLDDFAAAQAGGADADALALSVDLGMDGLQVEIPAPLAHVVGVADAVSGLRLAAADFTLLCHFLLQVRLLRILFEAGAKPLFYRTKRVSDNRALSTRAQFGNSCRGMPSGMPHMIEPKKSSSVEEESAAAEAALLADTPGITESDALIRTSLHKLHRC
jgi:hypothetical protein